MTVSIFNDENKDKNIFTSQNDIKKLFDNDDDQQVNDMHSIVGSSIHSSMDVNDSQGLNMNTLNSLFKGGKKNKKEQQSACKLNTIKENIQPADSISNINFETNTNKKPTYDYSFLQSMNVAHTPDKVNFNDATPVNNSYKEQLLNSNVNDVMDINNNINMMSSIFNNNHIQSDSVNRTYNTNTENNNDNVQQSIFEKQSNHVIQNNNDSMSFQTKKEKQNHTSASIFGSGENNNIGQNSLYGGENRPNYPTNVDAFLNNLGRLGFSSIFTNYKHTQIAVVLFIILAIITLLLYRFFDILISVYFLVFLILMTLKAISYA
jgi:hypothetical protein